MFEKFILPVVSGVVSTLIATLVTTSWSQLNNRDRWLISGAVGVITIVVVAIIVRRPKKTKSGDTRVASGIDAGKSVGVKGIDVTTGLSGSTDVASDIRARTGDVNISDVKVHQSARKQDGTNED